MPQPSPLSLFCLSIPHTPNSTINTHTRFLFFISMCWYWKIAEGTFCEAGIQLSTISLAISCFPLSSPLNVSVPLAPCLSLYLLLRLCTHLFCLTSLHLLLYPQHSCTCPLTRPPSSFGSHSHHQSLYSFLFLHLFCSPLHCPAEHILKYWKVDV